MAVAAKKGKRKRSRERREWKRPTKGLELATRECKREMRRLFGYKYPLKRPANRRARIMDWCDSFVLARAISENEILKHLGGHSIDTVTSGWLNGVTYRHRLDNMPDDGDPIPEPGRLGRPKASAAT